MVTRWFRQRRPRRDPRDDETDLTPGEVLHRLATMNNEVQALAKRVEELERQLERMGQGHAPVNR